jgi:putative acetyltransferase
MNPKIVIRSETDADVSAISEVTVAAFKTLGAKGTFLKA